MALILAGAGNCQGICYRPFSTIRDQWGPFVLGISSGSKLLALVMVGFLEWNITINSGMLVAAAFAEPASLYAVCALVARKMETDSEMLIVRGA